MGLSGINELQISLWTSWTNYFIKTANPFLFVIHKLDYMGILSWYILLDVLNFH